MANFKKVKKGRNLRRKCELCETNIEYVDYKNVEFITKFISGIGQIKLMFQQEHVLDTKEKLQTLLKEHVLWL